MSPERAAVFTPAIGPGVGIGHLRRCQGIAEWFAVRGWEVSLKPITVGSEGEFASEWERSPSMHGFEGLWIIDASVGAPDALARTLGTLPRLKDTATCVIDSGSSSSLTNALEPWLIPDLTIVPHGEPGRRSIGRQRIGLGYTVFRPGVYSTGDLRSAETQETAHRLLVTAGGVDAVGVSAFFMDCLQRVTEVELEITLLVGPNFDPSYTEVLETKAQSSEHEWSLVRGALSALEHSRAVDLALSAGGLTKLEMTAAGVPTAIVDETVTHGRDSLLLHQLGAACALGTLAKAPVSETARIIEELIFDRQRRDAMSATGRALFSKDDAMSTIEEIEGICRH